MQRFSPYTSRVTRFAFGARLRDGPSTHASRMFAPSPATGPSQHRPQLLTAVSADLCCPAYLCHCCRPPLQFRVAVSHNATTPSIIGPPPLPQWLFRRCRRRDRYLALRSLPPLSPPHPGPARSALEGTVTFLDQHGHSDTNPTKVGSRSRKISALFSFQSQSLHVTNSSKKIAPSPDFSSFLGIPEVKMPNVHWEPVLSGLICRKSWISFKNS